MRSLVISTTIVAPKHLHLFTPKRHRHLFLSPPFLLPPSLSTPNPPSSSPILTSPRAELASKLGEFEEFKLIVETLASSEFGGKSGFGELLNSEILVSAIVNGIKKGRIQDLIGLFGCLSELGVDVLGIFDGSALGLLKSECRSLVHKGHLEAAVEIMEVLAGLKVSVKDLVRPSELIRMFISRRSPHLAVRYACLLPHAEVVVCSIIKEFGKKADLPSAVNVFEASKQKLIGHNMYVYRTMIDVCGLCGDFFKSRLIYEDLLNLKVTPNIYFFNSLMNVNSHDLTYTLEVYKQMQEFSIEADMTSYNILLKACCLSERVDFAQDIYMEVKRLESTGALKLDVFTYSTIIKVFADAKLWQMAINVKEDMLAAGVTPNTVTWSSLISACANAGLVDQATQLFGEMLRAGCEPNSQCINTLLHACVEACQYDRAFRLFNAWKSSGSTEKSDDNSTVQPIDGNRIAFPSHSDTAADHLSFVKSIPFKPTTSTYNILLKACGTDFYHAKRLLDEMKTFNLSPDQKSWSILIDISGSAGNVRGALQILKTMGETGIKLDVVAYTTAIKVCVESKNMKMAFSLFSEMKKYRIKPNLVTYNTLLRARSKYDSLQEIQKCLAIYQDMRRAGYKSNDFYLKLLIEEWCEGVLQKNNQETEYKLRDRADIGGLRSLLLDRVAIHLQKNTAESLVVDIQGLTKVEARLVVLAVLRMIRESYVSGRSVQDDLVVILGVPTLDGCRVKDAITKLLEELVLEVLPVNPCKTIVPKMENNIDSNIEGMLENNGLLTCPDAPTRRPAALQRLVVPKKSLNDWLRRKLNAAYKR